MFATVEQAVTALKSGRPIIVVDDENRENEGDFVALAEWATPEMINFMVTNGRGLICVPIEQSIAKRLALHPMTATNTDPYETAFTISVDAATTHTGISAYERSETILKMIDEQATIEDFKRPGHIFPLIAKEGGVLTRRGHTEACVDLAKIAGSKPAGVICEILNPDGTMARMKDLQQLSIKYDIPLLTIEQLVTYRKRQEQLIYRVVDGVNLPTKYGLFQVIAYVDQMTGQEHLALVKGNVLDVPAPLVRIHSECLTGDAFGSLRCDCGPQLDTALKQMNEAGAGILLYMRQEGRGIGLINKMKAYKLQQDGFDTVEANERLGFADDAREYILCAQMLQDLQVKKIQLLTNNPRKIQQLQTFGIQVENRVPIEMPICNENKKYMTTKKEKLGHFVLQ